MLSFKTALVSGLLLLGTTVSAQAGWQEFWDRFHLDFHRNNCWPHPFNDIDRQAAQAPFAVMVANGWRRQNTLGQVYFRPDTQQLNQAGEHKLYWILTQAPEEHRTIYVVQSPDPQENEARMDAVQQTIARLLPNAPMPPVTSTHVEPRGWPADYIDTIDRKVQATIPEPRLPKFKSTTTAK